MEPFKEGSKVPLFFGINTSYIKFEFTLQYPESKVGSQRPNIDFISQKATFRGLKSISIGVITTLNVPNLIPRHLKSTSRGLKCDFQQTSGDPKDTLQTLRAQKSTPRGPKIDSKMNTIFDSQRAKVNPQSAKSITIGPKLTWRVKNGLPEAQNRGLMAKNLTPTSPKSMRIGQNLKCLTHSDTSSLM